MPTTRTFDVYKFQELSGKAKERAKNYLSERIQDGDWYSDVYDDWREKLESFGFMRPQIYFSHMYCQGQGACFVTRDGIDIEKWLKAHKLGNQYRRLLAAYKRGECGATTYHSDSLYWHYNTMYIHTDINYMEDEAEAEFDVVADLILEDARQLARQIYRDLEEYHLDLTSDESIADYADGYGFLFMEDGYKIEGDD